jgi:GT2 family glycosyltransferase
MEYLKTTMPKLGIGLPVVNRCVDRDHYLSMLTMDKPRSVILAPKNEEYGFSENIAEIRNEIVRQAIAEKCTHLIMCDTDQIYPQDTITKLMNHNIDVVGAVVHRRYPPFAPILYRGELGSYQYAPYEEWYSGNLIEVDATGAACILINIKIFEEMDPPWFELRKHENGKRIGEDVFFCHKLRSLGKRIFVDTSIQIDHMSVLRINRGTFELFKRGLISEQIAERKDNENGI